MVWAVVSWGFRPVCSPRVGCAVPELTQESDLGLYARHSCFSASFTCS